MLMSLILEVDGTRLIREKLREGTIATDLMKPISVPLYFFSDGIGQTLLHALLVVPSLLFALLLVRVDVPPPATLAVFALTFAIGYGVNFFLNFLMNCVAFWTLETFAAQLIVRWISDLLSGQIIPLTLFSRHLRPHRPRTSFCRRLLDPAADLRRRDTPSAVGCERCAAVGVAGPLCRTRLAGLARGGAARRHSGRIGRMRLSSKW